MAVNIDTVYQKVLALANKEQRGYITPHEFNLLANKAQLDLLNGYFHAAKMAHVKQTKNQLGVAIDELDMIEEKLHPFKTSTNVTLDTTDSSLTLPSDLWSLDVIWDKGGIELTEINKKDAVLTQNSILLQATFKRPVYFRSRSNAVTILPTSANAVDYIVNYYYKPRNPEWGYVVVNEKALYNPSASTDFTLHLSEEETVVTRILELAGLSIKDEEIAQAAMVDKQATKQNQNS